MTQSSREALAKLKEKIEEMAEKFISQQQELEELRVYKEETIWRLTDADFLSALEDKVGETEAKKQASEIIERAHHKFTIEDSSDCIDAFIHVELEKEEV